MSKRRVENGELFEVDDNGEVTVPVPVSEQAWGFLGELKNQGLFGATIPEVVQRLVYQQLQSLTVDGWLSLEDVKPRESEKA